ncbi:Rieske 2Fe-2S domain-containing protein [Myxococcaceae bacterium GXIMD 01537]
MDRHPDESFIPVARLTDLDARGRAVVVVGGRRVALVRVEGRMYALNDACPHRGGPLSEGDLDGFLLHCPLHAWPFDVRTGGCPANPRARVRIHDVRVVDDEIQLAASASLPPPQV